MFAPPAKRKWNEKPLPVNIKPHVLMIKVMSHHTHFFWSTSEALCDHLTYQLFVTFMRKIAYTSVVMPVFNYIVVICTCLNTYVYVSCCGMYCSISIFFQFLTSWFEAVSTRDSSQVALISDIIHQSFSLAVGPSCSHPYPISQSAEVISAKFRYTIHLHICGIQW